eukprot:85245-Prorocentrum_minimum.AAC.2
MGVYGDGMGVYGADMGVYGDGMGVRTRLRDAVHLALHELTEGVTNGQTQARAPVPARLTTTASNFAFKIQLRIQNPTSHSKSNFVAK